MSEITKQLRDRRLNVWEQAKAVAAAAADQNRAFSAEEQGTWDALNGELDQLDKRIKSALETEQRSKDADDAFNRIQGRPVDRGSGSGKSADDGTSMEAQLRSFLRGEQGAPRAFEVKPQSRLDLRALSTSATGAGGNLLPTSFYNRLVAHLIEVSGVMQTNPTVLNTTGGENLQIPKTTSHSTATSAAQATTLPSSDPAFGLATLGAYKYGILLQVSRELIDDEGVDLEGYLAMQVGRALGNKFGADLVTGTGTSQPTGFMTSATVGVTGTTTGKSGVPVYGDLVDLQYSVIAPYRQSRSCYWIMRDATVGALRKITDTTGQPIWQPSIQIGAPDILLGKPLVSDPFMPAVATGAKAIAFGDFSQFFVRMVGGIRFERSDDFLFGSDMVAFRGILRGDGALVDLTGAIKTLQATAT
jgi:HK97 family phage major capsid protein